MPLVGLLCLGRSSVAYWMTVLALGHLCLGLPMALRQQFAMAMAGGDIYTTVLEMIGAILMVTLFVWLSTATPSVVPGVYTSMSRSQREHCHSHSRCVRMGGCFVVNCLLVPCY